MIKKMTTEDELKAASLTYALLRYVKQEENIDVQIGAIAQTLCHLIKKRTNISQERLNIMYGILEIMANSLEIGLRIRKKDDITH
jgi:predicted transposase YdaD